MRQHILAGALISGSLFLTPTLCLADDTNETDCGAELASSWVESGIALAPLSSPGSTTNGFELTGGDHDGVASVRLGKSLRPKVFCTPDRERVVTGVFTLTLSAPTNSDEDSTALANLDGLANGGALEIGYRRLTVVSGPERDEALATATCDKALKNYKLAGKHDEGVLNLSCTESAVKQWDPTLLPIMKAAAWGKNPAYWIWGGTVRVGTNEFKYLDPATLAKMSDDKGSWAVKLYGSYRSLDEPYAVSFSYERQSAWEGQDEAILCPAGGGVLACSKGPPGPPSKVEKDIASVEFRRLGPEFGFAIGLAYDARNDVAGIDVPIYLTTDKDGAFVGGLRFGWRSDTSDVTAAVFVSKPFGLPSPKP